MKYRLLTLSLIALFAFAGAAFADEAVAGVDTMAPVAAEAPQADQALEADASCPTSPALPFVTGPMDEATPARCPYFQCVNSCSCPSGCVSYCVSIQWCECDCDCG